MDYYYSAASKGFYLMSMKDAYTGSENGWPVDAIAVSQSDYEKLIEAQSFGGVIETNAEGYPIALIPDKSTYEYLRGEAVSYKNALYTEATRIIEPLQDAVDTEMATPLEVQQLLAWKKYRVQVNRIDTSLAPTILWPDKPE